MTSQNMSMTCLQHVSDYHWVLFHTKCNIIVSNRCSSHTDFSPSMLIFHDNLHLSQQLNPAIFSDFLALVQTGYINIQFNMETTLNGDCETIPVLSR